LTIAPDFGVRRREGEAILLLGSGDAAVVPSEVDDIPVRVVAAAEIAAARTWIRNWQRMLPVIVASRGSVAPGLTKSILRFVITPIPLAHIEREFSIGDPTLARATVFELLRVGRLRAPSLRTESLSSLTLLGPSQ